MALKFIFRKKQVRSVSEKHGIDLDTKWPVWFYRETVGAGVYWNRKGMVDFMVCGQRAVWTASRENTGMGGDRWYVQYRDKAVTGETYNERVGSLSGWGLEIGLPLGFIGALQGSCWYQDFRGMLKGTQAGTWISLSVRQKHPLHGRSTGGIEGLRVDAVWHWEPG